jgi:two-component system sensor histidine kinase KdpD
LLHGLANEHRALADDNGVVIRVHVAEDVDIVRGDRVLLNQALSNLLVNACKYAPDSGDVALFAARSGGELVLGVQDRGPGIAGQDQMRLFEKFYRVKRHGAGKAKGSGLGLAIVKRIAERHDGRAWCESDLGRGSTFFIALPLAPQE